MGAVTLAQQNYIEVIDELIRLKGRARTCDIAQQLEVSLPSVSEVVGRLAEAGLVTRKSRHEIVLTAKSQAIVGQLDRRQKALQHFMTDMLGIDESEAEKMACELEHVVAVQLIDRLLVLDRFMDAEENCQLKLKWEKFRFATLGSEKGQQDDGGK